MRKALKTMRKDDILDMDLFSSEREEIHESYILQKVDKLYKI